MLKDFFFTCVAKNALLFITNPYGYDQPNSGGQTMLEEQIKIEQDKLREIIRAFQAEGIESGDAVFIVLNDCIELANMAIRSGEPMLDEGNEQIKIMTSRIANDKIEKRYWKMGELSEMLDEPPHTIRFWEKEIGMEVDKNHRERRYTIAQVEELKKVRDLGKGGPFHD
jgi:uncharacterized protein YoaH (UPF0181 family)